MILGLGNDIIDIRRVERIIERYGDRFLSRVFTDIERWKSDGRAGLTPEGCQVRIDLTITDDFPMAQAIVIISAFRVPMRD